jgi:hypothetical protein
MEKIIKHLVGAGLALGVLKLVLVLFAVADAYYQAHHNTVTGVAASTYAFLAARDLFYD